MKIIISSLFICCASIKMIGADGSATQKPDHHTIAHELTAKARAVIGENPANTTTATAYHTLALLAALSSPEGATHPSVHAARTFLEKNPVDKEKLQNSDSTIGWLRTLGMM